MIIDHEQLPVLRSGMDDATLALRLGCYDLLHVGHIHGLDFAKEQADILVVGVASDERVKRLKGQERPILPEDVRVDRIDQMHEVDYTFVMPASKLSWLQTVWSLRPDTYVEGNDHFISGARTGVLKALGINLVVDPGLKHDSTSDIIQRTNSVHEAAT
jgi:cytidyltransferase-like protein